MITEKEKRKDKKKQTQQYNIIKDTKKRERTHDSTQHCLHIPGEKWSNCQKLLANWQEN